MWLFKIKADGTLLSRSYDGTAKMDMVEKFLGSTTYRADPLTLEGDAHNLQPVLWHPGVSEDQLLGVQHTGTRIQRNCGGLPHPGPYVVSFDPHHCVDLEVCLKALSRLTGRYISLFFACNGGRLVSF